MRSYKLLGVTGEPTRTSARPRIGTMLAAVLAAGLVQPALAQDGF